MDFKEITELIRVMSESKINKLEIEENGISIKMEKSIDKISIRKTNNIDNELDYVIRDKENISNSLEEGGEIYKEHIEDKLDIEGEECIGSIISPIVGTFYAAPAPDKDDFVQVGSFVKKGDTLCIVEAMKLMNEIKCDLDGKIVEILVKDGEMVEYGQELFKIIKD
ncbi:acetyl-CoA carboxylase biotin carboxyl carrier protein [Clostridium rectalis]|uniref:acetyl-CoA carboxylase biotin carboxyl carrier protein n=1 Tax=Clostridium rectalis TaxID=2040295 RepID=UPI000F643815|nr:acetyl-CoA carboxylase biotin carboxyl carrier protein [Clostridium rectalis]